MARHAGPVPQLFGVHCGKKGGGCDDPSPCCCISVAPEKPPTEEGTDTNGGGGESAKMLVRGSRLIYNVSNGDAVAAKSARETTIRIGGL